mmetsp:Transcript_31342/g.91794  ORF Transcript_31342/g.91794 Transcript_31342/m.91794 type:complete len:389 (+) Transcript_31342:59-1225(+)
MAAAEEKGMDALSLYRCAASYAWDDMKELCRRSGRRISETKNMPGGDRQASCLRKALVSGDEWKNTALHICIFNGAPLDAIDALLTVAERCARPKVDLTRLQTSDGSTPLLIGCATGAHVDVLRLLIDKSSDAKAMAILCDGRGRTPLLELCEWYDQKGRWKVKPVAPSLDRIRSENELETWMSMRFFWERAKVVLAAASGHRTDTASLLIYESSAQASPGIPPILSELIYRIQWEKKRNDGERCCLTALDIAISRETDVSSWTEEHFYNNAYYVRHLLRTYPTAARLLERKKKQSPLCLAIASGLRWENSDRTNSNVIPGPVQSIWEAIPDALMCKDDKSGGVYPFMLAACFESDDRTGVETVYNLLRLSPQLIDTCTTPQIAAEST